MAEPQDKLLGVATSDGSTTRTYSAYRIDYDSSDDLATIAGVDDLDSHYTDAVKDVSQTAIDRGYYTVKDGYQSMVLVASATTRDEVQTDLDNAGVSYTTESITVTEAEKVLFERENVSNGQDIVDVLAQQDGVVDRKRVSSTTKQNAATAIDNLSSGDTKTALVNLYEVMTGETPSETLN